MDGFVGEACCIGFAPQSQPPVGGTATADGFVMRRSHAIGLRNVPATGGDIAKFGPHNHGPARLSTKAIAYELFERLMARSFQRKSWMGVERYVPALIRSVPTKPNYPILSSPESDQR
jgi:hypothetical protein